MDAFLDYLGLYRSDVAKDGSCLFRVVSEQLFYTQVHHVKLRECCVDYMERNRNVFEVLIDQDFDEYLERIRDEKEWAGDVEMKALSSKYKIDFIVYYDASKPPLKIKAQSATQTISLACTGGNRYDCVYSKSELSALAFCQSIVYEVLYKKAFELGPDVDVAVEKMLHDKAYSKQRRNNLLCHYFRESCHIDDGADEPNLPEDDQASFKSSQNPHLEIRKALAQGVPPFPYKVAKTLDPGIYRNVEFDMWNEKRKEDQKNEQFIVPKLEPGVKCNVHINKDIYVGHVQDIFSNSENVSIYIEKFCKRCVVPSNVLEVVPVPAYKALTWQGGKTYKVYSDCAQAGSDADKKYKKGYRKNQQEQSPTHSARNTSQKPNALPRSNSMPTSNAQRSSFLRSNNLYSSPQLSRKKGYSVSSPVSHKSKNQLPKNVQNGQPMRPQNFPCVWSRVSQNLPTSPIPIPGKGIPDCYQTQPASPEMLNDLNDSAWTEDSLKNVTPTNFSPTQQYTITAAYSETGYSSISGTSPYAVVSTNATSLPLPIPGSQVGSPPASDEAPAPQMHPSQCPTPMAVYPYPVYAVPSMYLVCRDGSTLPVNISGPWGPQEAVAGGEVSPGVPSMYFNTPPTGMSPPVTSWIPAPIANYGSAWTPAMSSAVAFSPPMEVNTFQSILSPPWSPQSGLYVPPATAVAYQVQQPQPQLVPHEVAQN